jgi:type I restriction enzyme S subunit
MNEGGDFDKLGRGYVWEGQIADCIHQNHVFAVRPSRGVNPYWVNLATQASYLRHFFILRSKQSTNLASISSANLGEAPIPMPPETEVEAILLRLRERLRKLDHLVRTVAANIERLCEYRQALLTAAVTGKIDVSKEAA